MISFEQQMTQTSHVVETRLKELLSNKPKEFASVLEAMKYSLMAGGKRIRP